MPSIDQPVDPPLSFSLFDRPRPFLFFLSGERKKRNGGGSPDKLLVLAL
jgi:hypothetical protein